MKLYTAIIIILSSLVYCSCKKIVTLNLNTISPEIVIQGEVTDMAGPYEVMISQSVNFYADNTYPAVSGAVVKISDDEGTVDSLTETAPGTYSTHTLEGVPGHTYTLSVLAQNTSYTAVSTMPQAVPLDSITLQNAGGFGPGAKNQITPVVNFQDPAGIQNAYQFILYINGMKFNKDIFVFNDRLSDGKYISAGLFMDSTYLNSGDFLQVQMNCIDENVYNYFYQLSQSSGAGAFNTSASPANPSSNISNGALGYFSAHTTQSRMMRVY